MFTITGEQINIVFVTKTINDVFKVTDLLSYLYFVHVYACIRVVLQLVFQ